MKKHLVSFWVGTRTPGHRALPSLESVGLGNLLGATHRLDKNPFLGREKTVQSILFVGDPQRFMKELHFECFSSQDPFQFPNVALELFNFRGFDHGSPVFNADILPSFTNFRHQNKRLRVMPFCRTTKQTSIPGDSPSSAIQIVSDKDQKRFCWTVATPSKDLLFLELEPDT